MKDRLGKVPSNSREVRRHLATIVAILVDFCCPQTREVKMYYNNTGRDGPVGLDLRGPLQVEERILGCMSKRAPGIVPMKFGWCPE